MKRTIDISVGHLLLCCTAGTYLQAQKLPVDSVDNRIGVVDGPGQSNCVIGPQLPFGSISPRYAVTAFLNASGASGAITVNPSPYPKVKPAPVHPFV